MLVAETCLLRAVRARLRGELGLRDQQCDIEIDDKSLPAVAEDTYYCISPAGSQPGERHSGGGLTWDLRINVKVTIFQKITAVARDHRRSVFDQLSSGLNDQLDAVMALLDNDQTLRTDAEALLAGTRADGGKFPESFRTFAPDSTPRAVYSTEYDAAKMSGAGDPVCAIARGIVFQRARFMWENQ